MEKLHKNNKNIYQQLSNHWKVNVKKRIFYIKVLPVGFILLEFLQVVLGLEVIQKIVNLEKAYILLLILMKFINMLALLIFDWSNNGPTQVRTKVLTGDKWKKTVKGYICVGLGNHPPPPQYEDDILQGPFAENDHSLIKTCNGPIPNDQLIQVVGKTDASFAVFASRLYAIVYFY